MLETNIAGVRVKVSFWFLAATGFFLLYERAALVLYLAAPVAIHELGHIAALLLCGFGVSSVELRVFGAEMKPRRKQLSYPREMLVTVAGAAMNLIAAGIVSLGEYRTTRMMLFSAANVAVTAFNLLPIGNLDGGALVRLIGERFGGVGAGRTFSRICSFLVLVPLFAFSFRLLLQPEPNVSLLIVCVYLAGVVIRQ